MMTDADATVLAALVAAIASLFVAIVGAVLGFLSQKRITRLEADLAERTAQRNARLEYEFEARKRLYEECEPLLFQLSELAERALGRVTGLARTAAAGDLDPGKSWMGRRYYNRSTYYRLIAPLAVGKLLSGKLTNLDLTLEKSIRWQYSLCKLLADTFTDDFDLARLNPTLRYEPHTNAKDATQTQDAKVYWQQGVPRGILENAVTSLIVEQGSGERTIIGFAAFESRLDVSDDSLTKSFARIGYLFEDFHPRARPVLWRILLAQAHLYRLLQLAHEGTVAQVDQVWGASPPNFDWCGGADPDDKEAVGQAIQAAALYVQSRTAPLYEKIWAPKQGAGI